MVVEALVLGDDEGVAHGRGDVGELDEGAALEPDLGDEAAVGGVELGGLPGRELVEDGDGGALSAAADERPRGVGEPGPERDAEDAEEEHGSRQARTRAPEAPPEREIDHRQPKRKRR